MNRCYVVTLSEQEREELEALVRGGCKQVRRVKRAQILLAADEGIGDTQIATCLGVGAATIYRSKRRFVEGGLEHALEELPRLGGARKLSAEEEALLIATACSTPPQGRARWTLELLAGEMVRLTEHTSISDETIRRRLHENQLKPWQKKMWCIPKVDAEFVARMEDVLDLYSEPPDGTRPVVCFDETPTQLIGEVRRPLPAEPGVPARVDYEYRRNGTANLFVFLDAHRGWREVKITDHRTNVDFAACMRDLVDVHYPDTKHIRVVLDNLSTHSAAALYQAFEPAEARRILQRLDFHFVPKHASWLNMVEIEISVLASQCLDRRIADRATLESEVAHWVQQRNAANARIQWLFDVTRARDKMGRAYPKREPTAATMNNPQAIAA